MDRQTFLARAFVVAPSLVALAACKETTPGSNAITAYPPIKLLDSRFVSSTEASPTISGGTVTYLVCRIEITNTTAYDWTPELTKVVLVDTEQRRYPAYDQGSSALVGISNPITAIKPSEKQTYMVGFRTVPTVTGVITYEY